MSEGQLQEPISEYDLIVIGGGFAGVTAALRAVELGLKALLIEQGTGQQYPCNSRYSGGIVHVGFKDIKRTRNELLDAIQASSAGEADPSQARALADNIGRWVDWLEKHGARFMRFNREEGYRWCMAPPRALVPGLDWQGRGPDVLLSDLLSQFEGAGGEVRLGTKARSLLVQDGVCHGVAVEQAGREQTFRSAAVLIADGGFQSDHSSFEKFIGPNFPAVFQRGAASGMGDGMRMAEAAGALMTDRSAFYGHLLAAGVHENDKLWPYPELDAFATAGVIVSDDGHRITNESAGGIAVANALAKLANPACATAIFDEDIWQGAGRAHRIPANPLLLEAGAQIFSAASLEQLAGQLGMPVDALALTVSKHNEAIESGTGAMLDPPRTGAVQAQPITRAPFRAIRIVPGITYTMGGIAIDGKARVLNCDAEPITGLFAAGAATGGLEGGNNTAYIGGLAKAGVFGMIAAEQVASSNNKIELETEPAAQFSAPTTRYPMLELIVRYGHTSSVVLAVLISVLVLGAGWQVMAWWAIPVGLLAGGVSYIAFRSYTEIVTLISDMLRPR